MENEIWTEKYRPRKLDEIVGHEKIVKTLKQFIAKKSLPHCLFSGPAGIGKTTTALCIAREFFGEKWKSNFLELNASDERGIDTIRTKVKEFARTKPIEGSFKIIYLDEADALTKDAQQALRRIMESYSDTCRFILACNYSSKIIDPIQSRCAIFRFSKLSEKDIENQIAKIAKKEKVNLDKSAIDAIIDISEGDMRKAINILQASAFKGKVTDKSIYEIVGFAEPEKIKNMINLAIEKKFKDARAVLLNLMYKEGLSGEGIIKQIHRELMNMKLDDKLKIEILKFLSEYEFRITEGANEQIQVEAFLAELGTLKK